MRLARLALGVIWLSVALAGYAAATAAEEMEEILVSGEQPGPALWQVTYGTHRLWILGTVSPLPAKLQWRPKEVEARIAEAQFLLEGVSVKGDIGLFAGLRLLPAVLKARKLPKGETLATVLDPKLYARWTPLKARYLPKDDSLEGLRPILAGIALYGRAIRQAGLSGEETVGSVVSRAAKKAKVPTRTPEVLLSLPDPRGLIREYAESPPRAESACLERVLTRVEQDIPVLQQRARAWASGDIDTLRRLSSRDVEEGCLSFLEATPKVAERFNEARRRYREEWLLAAEGAVLRHARSFAVLPMREILSPDGLLAQLRSRGYTVIEP